MKLRHILFLGITASLFVWGVSFAQQTQPAANGTSAGIAQKAAGIKVVKTALCHDIKDREPQEEVNAAKVGDIVVGWMQIQSAEDTTVTHRWIRDGQTISDVSLPIKSSASYRAWSRKTIGSSGNWKWQILDANGNVLKEVAFSAAS
jgi:hypothetical protein